MDFVILKGWHFSLPRCIRRVKYELEFTAVLHTPYDLKNVNQQDWNKLTGITRSWFRPNKNAFMTAFRWNVKEEVWEIAPYININYRKVLPLAEDIVKVKNEEEFHVRMFYQGGVWLMEINGQRMKMYASHLDAGRHWRIQPYFGGDEKSPVRMKVTINFK